MENRNYYSESASGQGRALQMPGSMQESSPDSPESASRIRDSVGLSEQALSKIHEAITLLEKRLDTVLTPMPPSVANATQGKAPTAVASHLLGRMGILNEGFDHAVSRLRDLARRIEV